MLPREEYAEVNKVALSASQTGLIEASLTNTTIDSSALLENHLFVSEWSILQSKTNDHKDYTDTSKALAPGGDFVRELQASLGARDT